MEKTLTIRVNAIVRQNLRDTKEFLGVASLNEVIGILISKDKDLTKYILKKGN